MQIVLEVKLCNFIYTWLLNVSCYSYAEPKSWRFFRIRWSGWTMILLEASLAIQKTRSRYRLPQNALWAKGDCRRRENSPQKSGLIHTGSQSQPNFETGSPVNALRNISEKLISGLSPHPPALFCIQICLHCRRYAVGLLPQVFLKVLIKFSWLSKPKE